VAAHPLRGLPERRGRHDRERQLRTSQIALPEDASNQVYATAGYEQSVRNLSGTSLASDNVFSDGYSLQLGKATGDVTSGMTVTLNVPV
jgi:hypothetical protein